MKTLPFHTALVWSAVSGALALAWEICWSRVCNYASQSLADAFGTMLSFYLLGLAAGALFSRRLQDGGESEFMRVAKLVAAANVAAFLAAPFTAWVLTWVAAGVFVTRLLFLLPVALCGMLFGVVFPMLCHRAVKAGRLSGRNISYLYVANILGSGFGSLFTGFVLMEHFGLATLTAGLLLLGHLWAEWLASWQLPLWARITSLALLFATPGLFADFFAKLFLKHDYQPGAHFDALYESRHGVVGVMQGQDGRRLVVGNGVIDSVLHNGINPALKDSRPFTLAAVHSRPTEVLVVGVASGTWTQIIAHHPLVEKVTAVEICGGYIDLIAGAPDVAPLLKNPKVEIVIDDGRRWMRNHPERKFDVLVMNTSYAWREFASSVLSVEFLQLARSRLKPGGVAIWNATGSTRAVSTGLKVFPHLMRIHSFCYGSMEPLDLNWQRWESVLKDYRVNGKHSFDLGTPQGRESLASVLSIRNRHGTQPGDDGIGFNWWDREQLVAMCGSANIITDDNLGEEYRKVQNGFRR